MGGGRGGTHPAEEPQGDKTGVVASTASPPTCAAPTAAPAPHPSLYASLAWPWSIVHAVVRRDLNTSIRTCHSLPAPPPPQTLPAAPDKHPGPFQAPKALGDAPHSLRAYCALIARCEVLPPTRLVPQDPSVGAPTPSTVPSSHMRKEVRSRACGASRGPLGLRACKLAPLHPGGGCPLPAVPSEDRREGTAAALRWTRGGVGSEPRRQGCIYPLGILAPPGCSSPRGVRSGVPLPGGALPASLLPAGRWAALRALLLPRAARPQAANSRRLCAEPPER